MTDTLSHSDFFSGVTYFLNEAGLKFPHNLVPLVTFLPGYSPTITKAQWDAYQWNPPWHSPMPSWYIRQYGSNRPADPDAGEKPTWAEIVEAANQHHLTGHQERSRTEMYGHCRKLICALYEGKDLHDEIYNRRTVRDAASPELLLAGKLQDDAKRAYLIRYHQIKNYINNTTDRTAMEAFNPTDDAHWDLTADWVRPDGEPTALDADDITGLAFTTDDVRKEERFRIDQIVDPGQLSRIQNDMISTILTEGIDQTQWTQAATDRWVRLQGFTGRIHTIQERCADIMDMDAIPTDFKEDHWWGATRYVPPADDNTPPSA